MASDRIKAVLLLIILLTAYILTNSIVTLIAALLIVMLPIISCLIFLISTRGIKAELIAPQLITDVKDNAFAIRFSSADRIHIAQAKIDIAVKSSLGSTIHTQKLIAAGIANDENVDFALAAPRTGKLEITVKKIKIYDHFGLFVKNIPCPKAEDCLIYPLPFAITLSSLPPSRSTDESTTYSQVRPGHDNTELFALHEYVEGDDLRKIHWKLSAKTDTLMVRDYALPLSHSLCILLDLSRHDADEAALSRCLDSIMSLSAVLLQQGAAHSLLTFNTDSGELDCHNIVDTAALAETMPLILASESYDKPHAALTAYADSSYRSRMSYTYYIAPRANAERISEVLTERSCTVILTADNISNTPALHTVNITDTSEDAAYLV